MPIDPSQGNPRDALGDPASDPLAGELRNPGPPPRRERDDELMADPPVGVHHLGRLEGYRQGGRMRLLLTAMVAVFVAVGVALFAWFVRTRPAEHARQFELPAGSDLEARPRTMIWSGGKARLGLDRSPPGVLQIDLPDRSLRLADGCDQAQMKIDVEDGKTTELRVIFGEIVEDLKPGARPKLAR